MVNFYFLHPENTFRELTKKLYFLMMNTLITLINEIRNNVNIVEYMFKVS